MFFSPDPFIQSPGDWKNYNRYGYCMNNPTRYTDPTGYTYNTIFQAVGDLMKSENGGTWTSGGGGYGNTESFSSGDEALSWGSAYNDYMGSWGNTDYHGRNESIQNYNLERDFQSGRVAIVGFKLDDNQYYMAYLDTKTGKFYNMNTNIETDPYSEYNIYNEGDKSENGLNDINTGIGVFGTLNSIGINIAKDYVSYGYKSANGWQEFSKLASNQQAWRAARVIGNTGSSVLKYAKGLGVATAALTTAYSLGNAGVYYYNGGEDMSVGVKSLLDVAMTGVGFLGPIGFGISVTYFVLDTATDGFGGYGKIK